MPSCIFSQLQHLWSISHPVIMKTTEDFRGQHLIFDTGCFSLSPKSQFLGIPNNWKRQVGALGNSLCPVFLTLSWIWIMLLLFEKPILLVLLISLTFHRLESLGWSRHRWLNHWLIVVEDSRFFQLLDKGKSLL